MPFAEKSVGATCGRPRKDIYMKRIIRILKENKGMELVQVAILIAIAVGLGLIFKNQITSFVNNTFGNLLNAGF